MPESLAFRQLAERGGGPFTMHGAERDPPGFQSAARRFEGGLYRSGLKRQIGGWTQKVVQVDSSAELRRYAAQLGNL